MKQWTFEELMEAICKLMKELHTDRLPTCDQLEKVGIYGNTLKKFGGIRNISSLTGIPTARAVRNAKGEGYPGIEKWTGRPSRAAEIEAKARKEGLHYADLQKEETLRIAGGINT